VPAIHDAWEKTLALATKLGASEYKLRAICGLWAYQVRFGVFSTALALAKDFGRACRHYGT
jgi:hypothetical protein